ncbi:MAG TPA: S49 family peptidase [Nevskiaceae bacterium]|nr:S49 family peptidase [Nevskiaceae bacterium]
MSFLNSESFTGSLVRLSAYISVAISTVAFWVVALCMVVGFGIFWFAGDYADTSELLADTELTHVYGDDMSDNKLLSIKITGTIVGDLDDVEGLANDEMATSGYDVKQQLRDAVDSDFKGVILEINSPGGTIYGSHAIAEGVKYYREHAHQPVYAHVQGLAASGAYWAAASADRVVADYGSDVGSIGVIMGPFRYYDKVLSDDGGVLTQNGIQSVNITAGKSKDLGDPYRRLTSAEVATLQQSVNNDYDLFVKHVSTQRHISEATIRNTIGALPYDNKTAQNYALIDHSGSREDVYQEVAKAAHLESEDYEVVRWMVLQDDSGTTAMPMSAVFHHAPARKAKAKAAKAHCTLDRISLAYYGDVVGLCAK